MADYVIKNHLDGADIDYEDSGSFVHGTGEEWLIKFTKQLRKRLPDRLITHAPQAPYFEESTYKNGAYMTIHREVGDLIDFYNVQFYNQGLKRTYDSYYSLFVSTDPYQTKGSSVREIINRGIPAEKIVVGKPATKRNVMNSGYMDPTALGKAILLANQRLSWHTGVMFWEYWSDQNGTLLGQSIDALDVACKSSGSCS